MKKTAGMVCLATVFSLVLLIGSAAMGAESFANSWGKVAFETPVAFAAPVEIGMGAVALSGQGGLEITLVEVPKDLQESMGNNPDEVIAYVKSTYLGTSKPAQGVRERTFLGRALKGQVQQLSIPRPGEMELYLVPLSGGDAVAVALTRGPDTSADEAAAVMEMVAATFRENTGK